MIRLWRFGMVPQSCTLEIDLFWGSSLPPSSTSLCIISPPKCQYYIVLWTSTAQGTAAESPYYDMHAVNWLTGSFHCPVNSYGSFKLLLLLYAYFHCMLISTVCLFLLHAYFYCVLISNVFHILWHHYIGPTSKHYNCSFGIKKSRKLGS